MPELTELGLDRFLVTGGAGFIGSHLVDRLLELHKDVYVLDDFSSGKKSNISTHGAEKRLRVIKGSVTDERLVNDIVRRIDCIYREAAQISIAKSLRNPMMTNRINSEGTLILLRACLRRKTRFVYASSSSVYGDTGEIPASEEMMASPLSPYAASKLSGESYAVAFARSYGLPTVALRYFNVYGKRQNSSMYGGVVSIFLRRVRRGLPPVIYGSGEQSRDFIHISDVVEANMRAASLDRTGEIINIGTGNATSIRELANMVTAELPKRELAPTYRPRRTGDIQYSRAEIVKQRSLLGFEPKIGLRDGIKSMLAA